MRKRFKVGYWLLILLLLLAAGTTYLRFKVPERQYAQTNQSAYDVTLKCAAAGFRAFMSLFEDWDADRTIAAFTIVLAFSTILLWLSTRRLVIGAENTAERQLRAYLHVDKCVVVVTPEKTIRQYVNIRNFGQTPAYKCNFAIWFKVWPNIETIPDFKTFERIPATAVLAPGGIIEADLSFDIIKGQEAINVLKGTANLYVWGAIFYIDAFDVERQTNFRMKYHFRKNSEAGFFRPTKDGNEAT